MKNRLKIIFNSIKVMVSYVTCLIIVIFYTMFADGNSGILLLTFMVLVPILSLIAMLIHLKDIKITLSSTTNDIKKGSNAEVLLNISKQKIVPLPFVSVTLKYTPHLSYKDYDRTYYPIVKTSMAFESSTECSYTFRANVSGMAEVYIKEAYIYDYLGFFRVKLKSIDCSTPIYITPEVKEINASKELFNSISSSVIVNDEEENTQNDTISIGSNLGYLHREYVEGDSPKRINWKLSCKKDKLMVRLDEPSPQSKPYIVLDASIDYTTDDTLQSIVNFEKLVESSLSLANMCVRNGIECYYIITNCEDTTEYLLKSYDDIYHLAVMISHCKCNDNHSLPDSILSLKSSDSMYLVFTDCYTNKLISQIDALNRKGILTYTILSKRYANKYANSNVWLVDNDLSINSSEY